MPVTLAPMAIYGTALLSSCLLIGLSLGRYLGALLGVDADIGGVGIAMILLIVSCDWLQRTGRMKPPTQSGVVFWGSIYVPIVVAMAASQNVLAAVSSGLMAIAAGALGVVVCFGLVALFIKVGGNASEVGKEP